MAISVNLNSNPVVPDVGIASTDTVTINSGYGSGSITAYYIRRRDGQNINNKYTNIRVTSNAANNIDDIVSIDGSQITVRLDFRTKYRVRVMNQSSTAATWGGWSSWYKFKTRDKKYYTPSATAQLTDDTDDTPNDKNNRTINVTNSAEATVNYTSRGATVRHEPNIRRGTANTTIWQTSKVYNGTLYTRVTSRGMTVENVNNDRGN